MTDSPVSKEQQEYIALRYGTDPIEVFNLFEKALIQEHSNDWTMEVIRESAVILSNIALAYTEQQKLEVQTDLLFLERTHVINESINRLYTLDRKKADAFIAELTRQTGKEA